MRRSCALVPCSGALDAEAVYQFPPRFPLALHVEQAGAVGAVATQPLEKGRILLGA
jgi:hypothetical protein